MNNYRISRSSIEKLANTKPQALAKMLVYEQIEWDIDYTEESDDWVICFSIDEQTINFISIKHPDINFKLIIDNATKN